MRIFAISDLHLPGGEDKPMDIFGNGWQDHFERISRDAADRVSSDDVILIPGDISWAMTLKNAVPDLGKIATFPGRKVIMRGNHDYWWSSVTQVRAALPKDVYALQNDALRFGPLVVCGTRGWICPSPGSGKLSSDDERIYNREVHRLRLSLRAALPLNDGERLIVMMHYPPFNEARESSGFTGQLESNGVKDVLYGHLHGGSLKTCFHGERNGVFYHQVSCDRLDFQLYEL